MSISKSNKLLKRFEQKVKDTKRATPVLLNESAAQKKMRVDKLLGNWELFMQYYFPHYCQSPFAWFHRKIANHILKNERLILANKFARDHAKTTFMQMMAIYMALTDQFDVCVWVSKSGEQAVDMLKPIKIQFEYNERLINDFGNLKSFGDWGDNFTLKNGKAFRALGTGQSPRGTKEEEKRPDFIVLDDIDDDTEVRNSTRLEEKWQWCMGALFGSFDIAGRKRMIWNNNIIAKDSLMVRACEMADHTITVNILDKEGKPSWAERYTLDDCMYMINKMGTFLSQREYFNNPVIEGKIFKADWLSFKKFEPLSKYKHLIAYLDPAFSGKNDFASLVLLGLKDGEYHVIKVYCDHASIQTIIDWCYDLQAWLEQKKASAIFYMEEVFMQALFYDYFAKTAKEKGFPVPIKGDTRKKPHKDDRIAATSGDWERGQAFLNEAEKTNHHMINFREQFLLFEMGKNGIKKDGPDAYEGARHLLKALIMSMQPPIVGQRSAGKRNW